MPRIILDPTQEQVDKLPAAEPDTPANRVRQALGWTLLQRGGIRVGGFELGNQHNPKIKKKPRKKKGA